MLFIHFLHYFRKVFLFSPAPNTDGMFNKLVTVFDSSCPQDKFVWVHVPGYAHLHAI